MANKTTEERAMESLRVQLATLKTFGDDSPASQNATTARNVLHEDIGLFGTPTSAYHFDEQTRDRLLAHARQDASHPAMNGQSAIAIGQRLLGAVKLLIAVVIICTALILGAIFLGR